MSDRRLSKLQKWILENCYKVTVLLDRTTLKGLHNIGRPCKCRDCPKTGESVKISKDKDKRINPLCANDGFSCSYFEFYKEDILLSYFLLTPNNEVAHIHRVQHFHYSPDYTKAHVSAHRSIKCQFTISRESAYQVCALTLPEKTRKNKARTHCA